MFNINNIMQFAQQMRNPQQMLQRMGIPQEHLSSPESTMKYLMDSGRINQSHIDQMNSLFNSNPFRRN